MPYSERPRWKDLRSGMACHLLRAGWTRDEVNSRLGHTPGSRALDAYINFLALDRDRPKQRLAQNLTGASDAMESRPTAKGRLPRIQFHDQYLLLVHELKQTRRRLDLLRTEMSELRRAVLDRS
jgi:hypothetical protein